ncbi:MAG: sugar phosphate nucleotidyltransferase, partial [Anaerolineales bacterium]
RAKPAVPIAGKYRLIDIPLSNCINSGIKKIAVLTQFKSVSLHKHISQTYTFDHFTRGWVQIFAAEQRDQSFEWYQGTADAVRKQLLEIESANTKYSLILAGDHLYYMNYSKLAAFHDEKGADITVAVQPVRLEDAPRFGLMKVDNKDRLISFLEKPKDPEIINDFVVRPGSDKPILGSMGLYFFNTDLLIDLLKNTEDTDFGGEIIPKAIEHYKVFAYPFEGYWEDIGTIRSFYDTNLSLTNADAPFRFIDNKTPIYTRPRFLPSSLIEQAELNNVLLADGSTIRGASINDSVIGLRSQVYEKAVISSTVMMGADYYDSKDTLNAGGGIPLGVGPKSVVEGAILDKNVRIGEGVTIKSFPVGTDIDNDLYTVRDGIVVIPKRTIIQPGTVIGPG